MGGPEALILLVVVFIPLAGALIFGLVCRSIARRKGRSTAAGFCWGFFLGIIGLVVCLSWPEPARYMSFDASQVPPGMVMAPVTAPAAPVDRSIVLTRIALGLGLGAPSLMLLADLAGFGWSFSHRMSWTAVVVAVAGVVAGVIALVTGHRAAIAACIGSAASAIVPIMITNGDQWSVLGLLLVACAVAALVLRLIATQREPVSRGYPFAPITVALAFAATSALPAFDRHSAVGWTIAVGMVTLACLGRGRFAPMAPLVIAVGYVGSYLEWRGTYWNQMDALDLIAGAALLLGAFYLLVASIPLPERRPVRPSRLAAPSPRAPAAAGWAVPAPPRPATPAAALAPIGLPGDDTTIVRPRTTADPVGLPLPPLPTGAMLTGALPKSGLPSYAAPTPAYAVPAPAYGGPVPASTPGAGDDWFAGTPAAVPAASDRRIATDRPHSPAWWILLILFGTASGIAPLVPFTDGPHHIDLVSVLPFLVVAAATILAGVVAACGYVSAYALAAGLAAAWGSMIVVVIWVIVDMIRVAAEFDVSLAVGPGFVLFIASAVLGLIVLIPALVEALRRSGRRAHPLLGLTVTIGAGMVIADVVRPRYGSSVLDGDTRYDVSIVVLVAVIGVPALLALLVRSGAAHAIAFGAMLLPATTVLSAAIDTYPQFDPLTAWGAALGGAAAAVGLASASERTMRRGGNIVRLPSGGVAIAVVGAVAMLVPAVVGAARTASRDDLFGGPSPAAFAEPRADARSVTLVTEAPAPTVAPPTAPAAAPPATMTTAAGVACRSVECRSA